MNSSLSSVATERSVPFESGALRATAIGTVLGYARVQACPLRLYEARRKAGFVVPATP